MSGLVLLLAAKTFTITGYKPKPTCSERAESHGTEETNWPTCTVTAPANTSHFGGTPVLQAMQQYPPLIGVFTIAEQNLLSN